jgi:hypothetical protein
MTLDELMSKAKDAITVKRVYGEPYEKGGVTVIPAAMVAGGGGGGSGSDESGGNGEGGGFGMGGRPAGAFVIKDGEVTWRRHGRGHLARHAAVRGPAPRLHLRRGHRPSGAPSGGAGCTATRTPPDGIPREG